MQSNVNLLLPGYAYLPMDILQHGFLPVKKKRCHQYDSIYLIDKIEVWQQQALGIRFRQRFRLIGNSVAASTVCLIYDTRHSP